MVSTLCSKIIELMLTVRRKADLDEPQSPVKKRRHDSIQALWSIEDFPNRKPQSNYGNSYI
jgi:hypothetical protein